MKLQFHYCIAHIALAILFAWLPLQSSALGIDQEFRASKNITWRNILGKNPRSYAVLIGITEYKESGAFPNLSEAQNDVNKMRSFLLEKAGFDYVLVLTEDRVTKEKIESIMVDKMPAMVNSDDRFLFYWSGHGIARVLPNGRTSGYLPVRSSSKNSYGGMVSMDDIARWDSLLNAKQTLFILDTCVSGLAGVQSKASETTLSISQLDRPAHHLFAAGTSSEEAVVGSKWSGSLFTDSLIRAASGAAANGSTVISLSDILVYVRRRIAFEKDLAGWSRSITPQLRQLQPSDGEFFFTVSAVTSTSTVSGSLTTAPAVPKSETSESIQKNDEQEQKIALSRPNSLVLERSNSTLDKIKHSGTITLAYSESSIPFSYLDDKAQPIGFGREICLKVVDQLKRVIDRPDLKVNFQKVTPLNRIPLLQNGTIDIDCGAMTNTRERGRNVAFAINYFYAGTRFLVKTGTLVRSIDDLAYKQLVSVKGTSNYRILRNLNDDENLNINLLSAKDEAEAVLMVQTGHAIAFGMDDILLYKLRAAAANPAEFEVVGEAIRVEPYAIMVRRDDPAFKRLVDDTIAGLMKSGEFEVLYKKWFQSPIPPKGINLQVPMSKELLENLKALSDKPVT